MPVDATPVLVPVVLSGGRGTRLWPLSREARPKIFLKMTHGRSLLQDTLLRAASLDANDIIIATNEDYYFQTDEEIAGIRESLDGTQIHYLLEPDCRGTAAALRMVARYVRDMFGSDALLLVLPSDHLVQNQAAFKQAVAEAASTARGGSLVALGVSPTEPETGFGYIECDTDGNARRFIEKPCRDDAQAFIAAGNYTWNSGIFCYSVKAIEAAFARHATDIEACVEPVWAGMRRPTSAQRVVRFPADQYARMPEISIDYAVMEKATNVGVVRADLEWQDIGSWDTMSRMIQSDGSGNRIIGQAMMVNSHNNFVQSDGRLVAAVGVSGLVIVDTPDALLVGAQGELQDVGGIADQLRHDGHDAGIVHRTVHRPWGTYTVIADNEDHKIKRLRVKPGAALSLQLHHFRSEHWVVIEGIAEVTRDDAIFRLGPRESTVIPPGCRHRIENPGDADVVIIETQTGTYLGEDDIVRLEDDYGRTKH